MHFKIQLNKVCLRVILLIAFLSFSTLAEAGTDSRYNQTPYSMAYTPQNLAANYVGIYSSGGCVPAPTCPRGSVASIATGAVGAAGISVDPNTNGLVTKALYGFRTYAVGDGTTAQNPANAPQTCSSPFTTSNSETCAGVNSSDPSNQLYWRVCIVAITEDGIVAPPSGARQQGVGQMLGSVMAVTRCIPTNGDVPSGSDMTWSQ